MKLVTKLFQSKSKHRFHGCLDDQAVTIDAHVVEEQKREGDHTATNSCWNDYRDDIDMKYEYWNKDTEHLNDKDMIDTSSMCQRTATKMKKTALSCNSILNRSWHRGSTTTDNTTNNERSQRHRKTIHGDKNDSNSFTRKNSNKKYSTTVTNTGAKSLLSSSSSTSKLALSSTLSSLSATDRTNTTTTTSLLDETSSSSNVSMFNDDTTGTAAPTTSTSSSCAITKKINGSMRSNRTGTGRGKKSTPKQHCAPWRVENILPNGKTFNESDWWRTTVVVPTNNSIDNNTSVDNNNNNTDDSSFPTHSSTDDDDEGVCYDDKFLLEHQNQEKEPFINVKADNNTEPSTTCNTNTIEPELLSPNTDKNDNNAVKNKSPSTTPTTLVSRTDNDTIANVQETFYNCGYATWVQVRHAWKNPKTFVPPLPATKRSTLSQQMISNLKSSAEKNRNRSKSTNNNSPTSNATNDDKNKIISSSSSSSKHEPPHKTTNATTNSTTTTTVFVPDSVKRDLVKCIKERRHFELSRSIPLKIIITAYNEAWADGEGL